MLREDKAGISRKASDSGTSSRAEGQSRTAPRPETLFSRRKFGPHLAGSLAATVIIGSASVHGLKALRAWVQTQPDFLIKPDQIKIHPEPPNWLIDGRQEFLNLVPELNQPGKGLSALEFEPDEIARRLRLQLPWVEKVESVEIKHPTHVSIRVTFRNPVMSLTLPDKPRVLLDRHGVILPAESVRKDMLDTMIEFNYAARLVDQVIKRGGKAPYDMTQGEVWDDARVTQSLTMAGFLNRQQQSAKSTRQLFRLIDAVTLQDSMILRTVDGLWIVWGQPPGQEKPGEPTADAKWKMLMTWLDQNGGNYQFDTEKSMIRFDKNKAILQSN